LSQQEGKVGHKALLHFLAILNKIHQPKFFVPLNYFWCVTAGVRNIFG